MLWAVVTSDCGHCTTLIQNKSPQSPRVVATAPPSFKNSRDHLGLWPRPRCACRSGPYIAHVAIIDYHQLNGPNHLGLRAPIPPSQKSPQSPRIVATAPPSFKNSRDHLGLWAQWPRPRCACRSGPSIVHVAIIDYNQLNGRDHLGLRGAVAETPMFMPVGTQGTVKGLTSEQLVELDCHVRHRPFLDTAT